MAEPVLGAQTKPQHIEKARQTILEKDEELQAAFHGQPIRNGVPAAGFAAHHYMLITNRRVIFWGRGLMTSSVDAFSFRDISSVDEHTGLLTGDIVLNIKGAKEQFRAIPKADVKVAARIIRQLIEQAAAPAPQTSSIPDQIKKLGELRDSGLLTEEEFQSKKAELLRRL